MADATTPAEASGEENGLASVLGRRFPELLQAMSIYHRQLAPWARNRRLTAVPPMSALVVVREESIGK